MTNTLPIWHCLSQETQEGLRPLLSKRWTAPDLEWTEWGKPEIKIESLKEIGRLIRQPRSR